MPAKKTPFRDFWSIVYYFYQLQPNNTSTEIAKKTKFSVGKVSAVITKHLDEKKNHVLAKECKTLKEFLSKAK